MGRLERIPVIDQLRGLAALSVAWFHLTNWSGGWVAASGAWGWLGVEAFFVISGFAIPYGLARMQPTYSLRDFTSFMTRRLIRIEPPYIASIALMVLLNVFAASSSMFQGVPPAYEPEQVAAHLLYLVPLTNFQWIQPVYWSLAWEFAFYLTIGLVFPFIGLSGHRWAARGVVITAIILVAVGAVSQLVVLFTMGFVVYRRLAMRDEISWTIALISASAAVMCGSKTWGNAVVGAATAMIILFHSALPLVRGRLGIALTGLGAISYSLYLVHIPIGSKIVNLGLRWVEWGPARFALSLVALVMSIMAAKIFWKMIERPSVLAARQLQKRGRIAETAAGPRHV